MHSITALETSSSPLVDSLQLVDEVTQRLAESQGTAANRVFQKLELILAKNPGLKIMKSFSNIISGDAGDVNDVVMPSFTPDMVASFKYAPVTSCDVERSFSLHKNILADNRRRLLPENLEKIIVCNCGSKSLPVD